MRAIVLAIVAAFVAQQPQPPIFRSGADAVEVDVVVHDKSGAFVSDLSVDDFEIQDNGQPQRVEQLYLHLLSTSRDAARPRTFVPEPSGPGARRTMIVVFDSEHMTNGGFKRVQDAALSLFDKQFLDGVDMGGVIADGRMTNNRLTSDRRELVKAVKDARPSLQKTSRLMDERQFPRMSEIEAVRIRVNNDQTVRDEVIRRARQDDPLARPEFVEAAVEVKATDLSSQAQVSANQTLQVLQALMTGLEQIEGRKTILLTTEGFIAEESWPLVRDAVSLAARANARIYTLDAHGLDRSLRTVLDVNPVGSDTQARLLEQMDFGGDAMNSLAVDTGGFVVRNTNDFTRAIARIADDAGNYYVLGFRSSLPQDGKFHKLAVRVKRKDVAVRARRGYVATPRPTPTATPDLARAEPVEARAAASEATNAANVHPEPAEGRATMTDAVPSQGLRVRPDAGKHIDLLLKNERADTAAKAGWDAYQRGDVAGAKVSLAIAATTPDAEPWVHYALGMSEYALREFKDAAAEWEAVRRAAPEFEPVYFDLVDGYLQLKDHDQAVRVLRSAKERWPRDPEIFNALGVVQTVRGAIDDALKSFQEAVAVAPDDAIGYFNLGRAFELRFNRSRHYVQQLRSWVASESDRTAAIENYRKYLEFGGPYAASAQEGVTRLSWTAKD
jgi:VWFA-related protein